jgi:hypothetical protein
LTTRIKKTEHYLSAPTVHAANQRVGFTDENGAGVKDGSVTHLRRKSVFFKLPEKDRNPVHIAQLAQID